MPKWLFKEKYDGTELPEERPLDPEDEWKNEDNKEMSREELDAAWNEAQEWNR